MIVAEMVQSRPFGSVLMHEGAIKTQVIMLRAFCTAPCRSPSYDEIIYESSIYINEQTGLGLILSENPKAIVQFTNSIFMGLKSWFRLQRAHVGNLATFAIKGVWSPTYTETQM